MQKKNKNRPSTFTAEIKQHLQIVFVSMLPCYTYTEASPHHLLYSSHICIINRFRLISHRSESKLPPSSSKKSFTHNMLICSHCNVRKSCRGWYLPLWRDSNTCILNVIIILLLPLATHCILHVHDWIPTAYQAVLISFSNPLTPSCQEWNFLYTLNIYKNSEWWQI